MTCMQNVLEAALGSVHCTVYYVACNLDNMLDQCVLQACCAQEYLLLCNRLLKAVLCNKPHQTSSLVACQLHAGSNDAAVDACSIYQAACVIRISWHLTCNLLVLHKHLSADVGICCE